MSPRFIVFLGALLAAMAVSLGAIGAHVLERQGIDEKQMKNYETAVRYQMYHALGLVLIGALAHARPSRWLTAAAAAMIVGCFLFSGGLYGYVAAETVPVPSLAFLKHVIPVGGGLFIVSWVMLAIGGLKAAQTGAE